MKNRNLVCYALDYLSIAALACAGVTLLAAIALAGAELEATLMNTFRFALQGAVAGFIVSRSIEIIGVLRAPAVPAHGVDAYENSNVETLPERGQLPRAA